MATRFSVTPRKNSRPYLIVWSCFQVFRDKLWIDSVTRNLYCCAVLPSKCHGWLTCELMTSPSRRCVEPRPTDGDIHALIHTGQCRTFPLGHIPPYSSPARQFPIGDTPAVKAKIKKKLALTHHGRLTNCRGEETCRGCRSDRTC